MRAVPLAPEVAEALAGADPQDVLCGDDDLVFIGEMGGHVDAAAKQALARAGLRQLRFHDLRHTFGTPVGAKADILRVKQWMGHADVQTTMTYLHYAPRPEDAQLVAAAFARRTPNEPRLFDGGPA